MSTPAGAALSYCNGADAVKFFDVRLLGDCLADDGTRVSATEVPRNANFQIALEAASGEVESACLAGGRYVVADLGSLTGVSRRSLQRIVALLAVWFVLERRRPDADLPKSVEWAQGKLEALRKGEQIFALVEVQEAAWPEKVDDQGEFAGVQQPLPSRSSDRFFGVRQKYLPG